MQSYTIGMRLCIFLLVLGLAFTVQGKQDSIRLYTPFESIRTHLEYLQPGSYEPDVAAMTLDAPGLTREQKRRLAIQLIQIYDGRGLMLDLSNIPNEADYRDSLSGEYRYAPFPEELPDVYLVRKGKRWLYSAKTVRKIPELHRQTFPYGLDRLMNKIPREASRQFLGLGYWQYLGIVLLVFFSWLLHKLLTFILRGVLYRLLIRLGKREVIRKLLLPTARPLSLFVISHALLLLVPILQLPIGLSRFLLLSIRIAIAIFVGFILVRAIDFLAIYLYRFAEKTESKLDDQLVPLAERTLKVLVWIGIGVAIMNLLRFNIAAVLTGLSISGLAVALAAQDTIKNLFGSLTIFVDKPFQVGDWIIADRIDGVVEEVGFRSTRIRTFNDSVITVPNGRLADMVIDNMGMRVYRRYLTRLRLTYDTPPALIKAFVEGIRQIIEQHSDTRKDLFHIYVHEFTEHGIEIFFNIFLRVADRQAELKAREEIILRVLDLAKHLGVRFALPSQRLYVEEVPGYGKLTPDYEQDPFMLDSKLKTFFKT